MCPSLHHNIALDYLLFYVNLLQTSLIFPVVDWNIVLPQKSAHPYALKYHKYAFRHFKLVPFLAQKNTGNPCFQRISGVFVWYARLDSNQRPLESESVNQILCIIVIPMVSIYTIISVHYFVHRIIQFHSSYTNITV